MYLTAELVRWQEVVDSRREMVRCEDSGSDSECSGQTNKRTRRAVDITSNDSVYGKKSKYSGKYSYIKSKTKALLLKYFCSPMNAIRNIEEFRCDDTLTDPKNRDYVSAAFEDFGRDLNNKRLREFYDMFKDGEPLFVVGTDYGTIEESLKWIDDLLRYQCWDSEEEILHFLNSLVDVIDRRISKLNTFLIHSPPRS